MSPLAALARDSRRESLQADVPTPQTPGSRRGRGVTSRASPHGSSQRRERTEVVLFVTVVGGESQGTVRGSVCRQRVRSVRV